MNENLRTKCLSFLNATYERWPTKIYPTDTMGAHFGYHWAQADHLNKECILINEETGDTIDKLDFMAFKAEFGLLNSLRINEHYLESDIIAHANKLNINLRQIGVAIEGEALIVLSLFERIKMTFLLIDENKAIYRRVI